jgi:hypothetical protein
VCRCPGKITNVTRYACCGQALELRRRGSGWHVQGAWGVFESGRVQLRPIGAPDCLLEQSVSPTEPLLLDRDVQLPEHTAGVELVLINGTGDPVSIASATV